MNRRILAGIVLAGAATLGACSDDMMQPDAAFSLQATAERPESKPMKKKGAPAPGNQTIAEIVEAFNMADPAQFTLLNGAIGYIFETNPSSSLIAGLLDNDQYTVFAPTDEAFGNLVAAVEDLLDPEVLGNQGAFAAIDDLLGAGTIEAVVSYHVTEGRRAANSVIPPNKPRTIETLLEGASFTVDNEGKITAVGNTANIILSLANTSASNGIIHPIDAVILPVDLGL